MTPFTYIIPRITESQNVRDRWHWSIRDREKNGWIQCLLFRRNYAQHVRAGEFRHVKITSYRPRLITDKANLIGGAKGLVDALVHCRLIDDDNDKAVTIDYFQFTRAHSPLTGQRLFKRHMITGKLPCTVITVSDTRLVPP